ncbi:hypothetical protein WME77_34605 [Sorangium sp. So ce764]|uniref:hypothetical protein n=1 Tax=Sorangium sp. So ce764 TaxID=3133320 RepID=UPI003F6338FD
MLELTTTLTHADGSSRTITIRIGDFRETHGGNENPWSAAVEILGFARAETARLRGRDWAEALEYAARFAAVRLADKVEAEGGGTLDPPLSPRPRSSGSSGGSCGIADDESDGEET